MSFEADHGPAHDVPTPDLVVVLQRDTEGNLGGQLVAKPAERTRAEINTERAAAIEETEHFKWLLKQRDDAVTRIRAAIIADQARPGGGVSERVLNLVRAFKEDWQDFRFGDLIDYDDVFEDSDHG
jgi:hypothetical protein